MKKSFIAVYVLLVLAITGCQNSSEKTSDQLIPKDASLEEIHEKALSYIQDKDSAGLELLDYASKKGFQRSCLLLGELYEQGILVVQDYGKAYNYYSQAAALEGPENAYVYYLLGCLYIEGLGRPINHEESFKWFKKSADLGNGLAQNELLYAYMYGEGTAVDREKAKEYARKSALSGEAMAQYDLGRLLLKGELFDVDSVEARYWLAKSAQQNHKRAFTLLGATYITVGVTSGNDLVKGVALLKKGEELGDRNARKILNSLVVSNIDGTDTLDVEEVTDFLQLFEALFSAYDSRQDSLEQGLF